MNIAGWSFNGGVRFCPACSEVIRAKNKERRDALPIGLISIYVDENGINSIGTETPTMTLESGDVGTTQATQDRARKLQWLIDHGMGELADVLVKMEREGRAKL